MNWKAIGVFSFLLWLFGMLIGFLFGMWGSKNEQVLSSPLYFYMQYAIGFVVQVTLFSILFRKSLKMPVLHAIIIVLITSIVSIAASYAISGLMYPVILLLYDSLMAFTAILSALFFVGRIKLRESNAQQGFQVATSQHKLGRKNKRYAPE